MVDAIPSTIVSKPAWPTSQTSEVGGAFLSTKRARPYPSKGLNRLQHDVAFGRKKKPEAQVVAPGLPAPPPDPFAHVKCDYSYAQFQDEQNKIQEKIDAVNRGHWGSWLNNPAGQVEKLAKVKVHWGEQKAAQLKLIKSFMDGVEKYCPEPSKSLVKDYLVDPQGFARDFADHTKPYKMWQEIATRAGFPINKYFQTLAEGINEKSELKVEEEVKELNKGIRKIQTELDEKKNPKLDPEVEKEKKRVFNQLSEEEQVKAKKKEEDEKRDTVHQIRQLERQLADQIELRNQLEFANSMRGVVSAMLDNVPMSPKAFIDKQFAALQARYNATAKPGEKLTRLVLNSEGRPLSSGSIRMAFIAETESGGKRVVKINRPEVYAAIKAQKLPKDDPNNYLERYKDFYVFMMMFKNGVHAKHGASASAGTVIEAYKKEVNPLGEQQFCQTLAKNIKQADHAVKTPDVIYLDACGSVETFMSGKTIKNSSEAEKITALQKMAPAVLSSMLGLYDSVYLDPHSGNLMNTPAILDFGRVGILNPTAHKAITTLYKEHLKYTGLLNFGLYAPGENAEILGTKDSGNDLIQPWLKNFFGMEGFNQKTWEPIIKETPALKAIKSIMKPGTTNIEAYQKLWQIFGFGARSSHAEMQEEQAGNVYQQKSRHGVYGGIKLDFLKQFLLNLVQDANEGLIQPLCQPGQEIEKLDLTHSWSKFPKLMTSYYKNAEGPLVTERLLSELKTMKPDELSQVIRFTDKKANDARNPNEGEESAQGSLTYKNRISPVIEGISRRSDLVVTKQSERNAQEKVVDSVQEVVSQLKTAKDLKEKELDAETKKDRADQDKVKIQELNDSLETQSIQLNAKEKVLAQARKALAEKEKQYQAAKNSYAHYIDQVLNPKVKPPEGQANPFGRVMSGEDYALTREYLIVGLRTLRNHQALARQLTDQLMKGESAKGKIRDRVQLNFERELFMVLNPISWITDDIHQRQEAILKPFRQPAAVPAKKSKKPSGVEPKNLAV